MKDIRSYLTHFDAATSEFSLGKLRDNPGNDTGSQVTVRTLNDILYALYALILKYRTGGVSDTDESMLNSDFVDAVEECVFQLITAYNLNCHTITDWNNVRANGWFMADSASNAPATGWMMGEVIARNSNYVIQKLYPFTADNGLGYDNYYMRSMNNGVWTVWRNWNLNKNIKTSWLAVPLLCQQFGLGFNPNFRPNITFAVGSGPDKMCFDGDNIWVMNYQANTVTKINVATNSSISLTVGNGPLSACFDGDNIWVTTRSTSYISKINKNTNSITTIPVPFGPTGCCFDGNFIWVTMNGSSSNNILKIDKNTNAIVATLSSADPHVCCFDGNYIWVARRPSGATHYVVKIDKNTNAVVATVSVTASIGDICFDGSHIWISNAVGDNVIKINKDTNAIAATIPVGDMPQGLCFDGEFMWVSNCLSNTISKLNISSNNIADNYSHGNGPSGICFDGENLWVTSVSINTVTKLLLK